MKKINVLIQKPNGTIIKTNINNTLEEFQSIVGGKIQEYPYIDELNNRDISVFINEEVEDLDPCLALVHKNQIIDYIYGNIVFVGTACEHDSLCNESLSDEQIEFIETNLFSNLKCLLTQNNRSINVIEL